MERKIYLIFSDSVDTVCEIKGYIRGTVEEAQAYCEDLNKTNAGQEKDFVWMELTQLPANQRWKTAMPSGFTTATKTAERWGVSRARVYYLCKEGRIPGVVYDKDHWCIPEDAEKPSIENAKAVAAIKVEGYLSLNEMAEKWGVHRESVFKFCADGRIPGAKRVGRNWFIPADAQKPANKSLDRDPGFITASKMAEKWGVSRNFVCKAAREGRIPGAKFVDGYWHVPEDATNPAYERKERKPGYTSATKTAEKWDTSRNFVCEACKEGRIPGAECINGVWHIPEDARNPGRYRRKRK